MHLSRRTRVRPPVSQTLSAAATWRRLAGRALAAWAWAAVTASGARGRAVGGFAAAAAWPQDARAPGPAPVPLPAPLGAHTLADFPPAVPGAPPPALDALRLEAMLGAHGQAPSPEVLDIDAEAPDHRAIAHFLGATGPIPKLAQDTSGKILLIYSSSDDPSTTQLASTNPALRDDTLTPLSLATLARWTPRLASQAGAAGAALQGRAEGTGAPSGPHTYWGTYRDMLRNVTRTVIADAANVTSLVAAPLADVFGVHAFAQIWAAAVGAAPAASYDVPALSADGESLDVTLASVEEVAVYLGRRVAPALGYSAVGRPYFVEAAGPGRVGVADLLSAGPYTPATLQALATGFTFLDSARAGNGTLLFADEAAGPFAAGSTLRLRDVRSQDGAVMLEVADGARAANLTLAAFQQSFGEAGMHALQAGVLSPAAVPLAARGVQYEPPPANATLWPPHPGPAMVRQDTLRDGYFLAALAAQLHVGPSYAYALIRPSADDNPWHSDARFFDPTGPYYRPFPVTVRNALPTRGGRAVSASFHTGGVEHFAVPLLEVALATANEQRHLLGQEAGLQALEAGDAGLAMQMLTGHAATVHPTYFTAGESIGEVLSAANDGNMVLLTTPASNGPGPLLSTVQGLAERQAYVVLNTTRDAGNRSVVHLFSPLRGDLPDGRGGVMPAPDGRFTLGLDDVHRGFDLLCVGLPGQ